MSVATVAEHAISNTNNTSDTDKFESLKPTPLRISTKVITANMGTPMNLQNIFDTITQRMIPLWYPGEGILKMEHDTQIVGQSVRDAFSKRAISDKTFFNQSTLVIRKATNEAKTEFKEVNVKLFGNGGIQMTGIPHEGFAKQTLEWVLAELKQIHTAADKPLFVQTPELQKFKVQLINSDYQISYGINRTALHTILSKTYGLFSTFESTIYQGVNTKYYYNTSQKGGRPGVCMCAKRCRGQGDGDGPGECKKITMSVFQTGKIIITGAREMVQLDEAYQFLNRVLWNHRKDILRSLS